MPDEEAELGDRINPAWVSFFMECKRLADLARQRRVENEQDKDNQQSDEAAPSSEIAS